MNAQNTRRSIFFLAVAALLSSLVVAAPGADAQVPSGEADFGGFATGTVVHVDALESGTTRVADVEVAASDAAADSQGLDTEILSELGRIIQPVMADQNTYGRGMALEAGLGLDPPSSPGQVQLVEPAVASAPPSTDLVTQELLSLPPELDPLLFAAALRGQAEANWVPAAACALGEDLSFGHAEAADVQLLDQDTTANDPEGLEEPLVALDAPDDGRAVVDTTSRTRLVPQVAQDGTVEGDALGVMSETRMTIAPITVNLGGQAIFTVEVLGEWVLRAVATGNSGYVHYGPGEASPETPILRIIDQVAGEVTNILRFQDLFGDGAIPGAPLIEIPELGIEIAIGEPPRAIGGPAQSAPTEEATEASAAVDVARIRLLDIPDTVKLAELRVGHMEVQARAPQGGVECEIPVSKTSDPESVNPGDAFTYTITVENPFQCTLTDVSIVDQVSASEGVTFEIDGASDGGVIAGNTVTWDDLDDIPPGETRSVTIDMSIPADSAAGVVIDEASADAACALGSADGGTTVDVGVSGDTRVELPEVGGEVLGQRTGPSADDGATPRTGGPLALGAALGLLALGGLAGALRRFLR